MIRFRSLVLYLCVCAFASTARAQTTALFYDGQPGALVGDGQRNTITSADATFKVAFDTRSVGFTISGPNSSFFDSLHFSVNELPPTSPGTYESARREPFNPFNGLDVTLNSEGCNELTGRFVILQIVFAPDGSLSRFAADFEQHCEGVTPALFGALRYNSTISDLTPFNGQYPVYSLQVSATHGNVTGAGLSCGTSGGSCQVTLNAATVVQLTAVPDPGYTFTGWTGDCHGPYAISINVYGPRACGATFDNTPPISPRTILIWNSAPGDYIGQGRNEIYSLQNALWTTSAEATERGVTVNVTGITDTGEANWTLEFRAPSGAVLQPGIYTGATRAAFATTTPGIDIFGDGRGCDTQSGQFTVDEIQFGPGPTLSRLKIEFVQHCEGQTDPLAPPLTGTIEYNSVIDIPALPVIELDKTQLTFGATLASSAFAAQTGGQTIRLTQFGIGSVSWTASSTVPWLTVSPGSGRGTATLTASVKFDPTLPVTTGSVAGSIIIQITGAANSVATVGVRLNLVGSGAPSRAPFGTFDTPVDGSIAAGSLPVTGWALDDIQVTGVRILRDPVAGETPGALVFVGNAVFIDGARPDVAAQFPQSPLSTRGGWGYLLLTNVLPNQGNGTFRLYAYADDPDGHTTLLGTKTFVGDNAQAVAPFGAIDTPGQGDVVSGFVWNFGWVLSRASRADPPGGGTVTVFVDGAPVGSPGGWTSRSDLSTSFPAYPGIDTALGVYGLDTTALANGVHTISWSVTDALGAASGIGSRFFTVSNAGELTSVSGVRSAPSGEVAGAAGTILLGRVGFDLNAPHEYLFPNADGVVTINAQELDRIELQLEAGATGAMMTPHGERPLPPGARIDPATGLFTWAPGAGFVGRYEFVVGAHRVRIVLYPKR